MDIIWYGQSCFKITTTRQKGEQVLIIIDPFSDKTGLKLSSFEADILLITHDHYDHNNKKIVKGKPFLAEGPGEYESKEVFTQGIHSFHDEVEGSKRGVNTIFTIETERIRLCHLGDLGQKELTSEQLQKIGPIDVLMIPIGGTYTIDSTQALKIINQIQPRIVIPMHYSIPKLKIKLDKIDKFLKEIGQKSIEPQKKLQIKEKNLPTEEMKVVVLSP